MKRFMLVCLLVLCFSSYSFAAEKPAPSLAQQSKGWVGQPTSAGNGHGGNGGGGKNASRGFGGRGHQGGGDHSPTDGKGNHF
jgi:hypothetical protein